MTEPTTKDQDDLDFEKRALSWAMRVEQVLVEIMKEKTKNNLHMLVDVRPSMEAINNLVKDVSEKRMGTKVYLIPGSKGDDN